MNLEDIYAQIELELEWRTEEIRFFQNTFSGITLVEKQDQSRRALILLLYAHFEGFCKFTLNLYINVVNQENISCGEANIALAAATLSDVFKELRNPEKKCDEFRKSLPDDTALHRFARDQEFIERTSSINERKLHIPDSVVDTESNLKPVVLRKNLFKLGFPHDSLREIEGFIHRLLYHRNTIAHGSSREGIQSDEYFKLRDAAFEAMDHVKHKVIDSLTNKRYLRN